MTDTNTASDLYEQFVKLSETAFSGEHYEAAYYALVAAMHIAYDDRNTVHIQAVKQLAREQMAWLNTQGADHISASIAAMYHDTRSVYENLHLQANAMLLRIRAS